MRSRKSKVYGKIRNSVWMNGCAPVDKENHSLVMDEGMILCIITKRKQPVMAQ